MPLCLKLLFSELNSCRMIYHHFVLLRILLESYTNFTIEIEMIAVAITCKIEKMIGSTTDYL